MGDGTFNFVYFNNVGANTPTFSSRSVGTKVVLYPSVGPSSADYAIGIAGGTLRNSVPQATSGFKFQWYGGTTPLMTLVGTTLLGVGTATPNATIEANGNIFLTNTSGENGLYSNGSVATQNSGSYLFDRFAVLGYAQPAFNSNGSVYVTGGSAVLAGQNLYWGSSPFVWVPGSNIVCESGKSPNAGQVPGSIKFYAGGSGTQTNAAVRSSTLAMIVDGATGNVGVGTDSPATMLTVNGTISSNVQLGFAWLGDLATARWYSMLGSYQLSFWSDNTSGSYFSTSSVFGSTWYKKIIMAPEGLMVAGKVNIGYSTIGGQLLNIGDFSSLAGSIRLYPGTGGLWWDIINNAGSININAVSIGTAVTIDSSRNVGIGLSPAYKLDVAGDINTNSFLRFTNSGHYIALYAPTLSVNTTYRLPAVDGAYGQCLTTDGGALLSWSGKLTDSATYTPVFTNVGPGTITVNTISGMYSRVGDIVTVSVYIDMYDASSPTGIITIRVSPPMLPVAGFTNVNQAIGQCNANYIGYTGFGSVKAAASTYIVEASMYIPASINGQTFVWINFQYSLT